MTCQHCHAVETTNGLALCELCRTYAASIFEMLPVYIRNLSRQRRPGRPNGSLGVSGQWLIRRGEADGSRINAALDRAFNDLDTWADRLADDRSVALPSGETDAETAVALCGVLEAHLTSIATLEWAGQFLRDMARHERALCDLTLTTAPGWYAGACRQVTGRTMEGDVFTCGTDTYVVPGLTWVTCSGCGAATHAADHLPIVLDEARDWIARPRWIAEAIVALVDTESSTAKLMGRIRWWAHEGWLRPLHRTERDYKFNPVTERVELVEQEVGYARYRFGDVLDQVLRDTRGAAIPAKDPKAS